MTSYLRSCAGCGSSFATGDGASESYFCRKCHAANVERFAPKVNSVVELLSQPRSRYVVLSVDNGEFTLRRLGFPESPTISVREAHLNPAVCR
ncbi:hypothetical protein AB0K92_15885 [Streptomyces sp. NPDC052687]|uniref:hypothetical protein n=1 Tax=Streptomyces sp. NPDC052687 TaxID=3154759 RepID=UPI00343E9B9C